MGPSPAVDQVSAWDETPRALRKPQLDAATKSRV